MNVDVLFVCWNRLAFTRAALAALLAHTDWGLVERLVVVDDGSADGTREWLDTALDSVPADVVLRAEKHLGPVAIMQRHLDDPNAAAWFAKIDNDCCVPAGWLPAMISVAERHPHVELLGMEAGMTEVPGRDGLAFDGVHTFEPATNIGGIGLIATAAFHRRPRMRADGRNGFTEWQHTHLPARGWIRPDLPVVLLDRLPVEPWRSLSLGYIEQGWQRVQGVWDERWMGWAWEWLDTVEVAA